MKSLDCIKDEIMGGDVAHDFEHIMRVYRNAQKICKEEKTDPKLVLCAALLHDIVSYPKTQEHSKNSSAESAKKSEQILARHGFSKEEITIISDAIRDHSFSQGRVPKTLEGKILQDADRLDALGAIGIARVFATGRHSGGLYNVDDPFCKTRAPEDMTWTVDHFYQKLLKLESLMNTESGKREAIKRTKILSEFLEQLRVEIQP